MGSDISNIRNILTFYIAKGFWKLLFMVGDILTFSEIYEMHWFLGLADLSINIPNRNIGSNFVKYLTL